MINRHLFLLIVFVIEITTNTAEYAGVQTASCQIIDNSNRPNGVCSSMDVRNTIESLKQIENCSVIEGYLRISLLDFKLESYQRISFPDLREITDYMLLYRVQGLDTLRHIFPNLTVIRGRQLFHSYSLVVYECRELQDLGLVNLRAISRGSVRLTKNFKLCYIDTVNWTKLGVHETDFKKNNKQCANTCKPDCDPKHCWYHHGCQKGLGVCPNCKENQSCMDNKSCCHEYCLGGCKGPTAEDCNSCKEVVFNNTCRPQCPPGTYTHIRRCLTDRECLSLRNDSEGRSPMLLHGEKGEPNHCVYMCPLNYSVNESKDKNYTECVKCTEFCHKECNGLEIVGVHDAQKLHGCSKISGSLTIQIMRGITNLEEELEKYLGSIREITQSLLVKKSVVLYSLHFFKSLEIIGGTANGSAAGFTFGLMDNQNLQDLFPTEQMKKLKLPNGKLLIDHNPQLCLHKIDEFLKYVNLTNAEGISPTSNGDRRSCLQDLLNLTVNFYSHTSVVLKWDKYKADERQLLTYILNYKEIRDLTDIPVIHYGRDSCSSDVWMTREFPPTEGPDPFQLGLLRELKPFTSYAVYIQAYTVTTATHSAMTDVIAFKTLPFHPSEPRDLIAIPESSNELRVKWKPPKSPNGIVKFYKIVYQKLELNEKSYEQRDYCAEPFAMPKEKETIKIDEEERKHNYSKDCCKCPISKEELDSESHKRQVEVYFEDYLHKNIYCKRYDKLPEEVDNTLADISINFLVDNVDNTELWKVVDDTSPNETLIVDTISGGTVQDSHNGSYTNVMEVEVFNSTEFLLPNLEPFSEYSIEVMACHETNANLSTKVNYCSIRAITLESTKPDWHMDLINESSIQIDVETNFTNRVFIKWDAPLRPNGIILYYNILYKKVNQDNVVATNVCIPRQEFLKTHGYRLKVDDSGNYTFKIGAVSLAGNRSYTADKFFIVPKPPGQETTSMLMIAMIVIGILVILIVIAVVLVFYLKQRFAASGPVMISRNKNYVPSDYVYRLDQWEVSRDNIKIMKELGQGSFGMVYEGIAKGLNNEDPEEESSVAIKTVNEVASYNDKQEFLKEATIMKAFNCHHVVKLLGVVSKDQPYLVIMELMALGDLKNYLRLLRPDEEHPDVIPPTLLEILQMAGEIADGMAYLSDNKFVHRDLAARNCMVAEDRTVKIGDFGMTRDIYETDYYRKGGKGMLPVRWMAPESLKDGVFTSMSDVWSYGVVLWEMVTLAAQPYPGFSNEEVVRFVSDGKKMDMPENCPDDLAYLMERCWEWKPNQRPSFKNLIEYVLPKLKPSFEKVSYYYQIQGETHDGSGDGMSKPYEPDDDSSSMNSLSCEGAAAPRQFSLPRSSAGGNSHFNGSDGIFQCDEEDQFSSASDFDDSSQPFMQEGNVPSVFTRQPLHLSHQFNGNDTSLNNSGQMELKPLIIKDRSPGYSSPRMATTVQQPSDYTGFLPPTFKTKQEHLNSSQGLLQNNPFPTSTADPIRSGPPTTGISYYPRPNLRLPILSQPPVEGFHNVSLFNNSGDNNKLSDTCGHSQPSSSDQLHSQPAAPSSNVNSVNIENGLGTSQVSSPSTPDQHYSSATHGAIASNSSDGSKESTKSSDSYSLRNGLKNGHIYQPSEQHRTAHC